MLRNRVLVVSYSILMLLSSIVCYVSYKSNSIDIDNNFVCTYMPNSVGISVFKVEDDYSIKCNLFTVNKIIENMIVEDFYSIVRDISTDEILDIVLENTEQMHRLIYYRETGKLYTYSSPKIGISFVHTYIDEGGV